MTKLFFFLCDVYIFWCYTRKAMHVVFKFDRCFLCVLVIYLLFVLRFWHNDDCCTHIVTILPIISVLFTHRCKLNGIWCDCHTSEGLSVVKPGSIHLFSTFENASTNSGGIDSGCSFVWCVLSFDFAIWIGTYCFEFPRSFYDFTFCNVCLFCSHVVFKIMEFNATDIQMRGLSDYWNSFNSPSSTRKYPYQVRHKTVVINSFDVFGRLILPSDDGLYVLNFPLSFFFLLFYFQNVAILWFT